MNELFLIGTIKRIGNTQEVTDTFKKRTFVIQTDEVKVQTVELELTNVNVDKINHYKVGDKIQVYFNVRGREWQKDATTPVKVFNSLHAWRIAKMNN